MDMAANRGHLGMVLYLLQNRSKDFSCREGNGYPANLEFLWGFRKIDCNNYRSGSQSSQQELQRLKRVFEERPDFFRGCLRSLAEMACERGNLEILDWLIQFGLELRSTIPIRNAVRRGDLALVRWFDRHDVWGVRVDNPGLLQQAAKYGYLDFARRLWEHGFQIISHEVVEIAAKRRDVPSMRWLIEHGPPLDLVTVTTLAIKYGYIEVAWRMNWYGGFFGIHKSTIKTQEEA
ncbi:unnamed protein product [Phytophthora lilii]|uniref:Unnamed protein product n=1 Tax=Phytophthora lilii TaxID=2077276 RepID=A0A9W6TVP1_9STRA|nr:unnamed protein product [Phytophthora lilii]